MNLNIELVKSRDGSECEIVLIGRLDAQTAPETEAFLLEMGAEYNSIILNFAQLSYISSAGLRALKALRVLMRKKGGTLSIRSASAGVMEIFEMTGFSAFFRLI